MRVKTLDSFIVGTSYIDLVLRDLRFIASENAKGSDRFFDEVLFLSDLYASAKRSLPSDVSMRQLLCDQSPNELIIQASPIRLPAASTFLLCWRE